MLFYNNAGVILKAHVVGRISAPFPCKDVHTPIPGTWNMLVYAQRDIKVADGIKIKN